MSRYLSLSAACAPTVGRTLLRVTLAIVAVFHQSDISHWRPLLASAENFLDLSIAVSLVIGFATPFSAISLAFLLFWQGVQQMGTDEIILCLGGASVALAMIGPGPWSLDALFFGRQRIKLPR